MVLLMVQNQVTPTFDTFSLLQTIDHSKKANPEKTKKMQILQTSLIPSQIPHTLSLSSSNAVSTTKQLSLLRTHHRPPPSLIITCGGGPRTYPGGVSKWQWKRMQSKKSKQLLKARLARERSIYEMRKRAELKAAVSNLERPWEIVRTHSHSDSSSSLFSVSADEQLKVLADRFQKPGGFDLWSENDGPQVFSNITLDDLPSSRFFPKGVVHSVKPYGKISPTKEPNQTSNGHMKDKLVRGRGAARTIDAQTSNGGEGNGRSAKNKRFLKRGKNHVGKLRESNGEHVFDMSLQGDGTYGFDNDNKLNQSFDH